MQKTKEVFNVIITVIAGISPLGNGIGIMTLMVATVTERTHEIGIRRAVGASRGHVLKQFLAESVLIAVVGGLPGIVAGIGGRLLVEQIFGFCVAASPIILILAALISAGVGVIFGLYPA